MAEYVVLSQHHPERTVEFVLSMDVCEEERERCGDYTNEVLMTFVQDQDRDGDVAEVSSGTGLSCRVSVVFYAGFAVTSLTDQARSPS